MTLPLKRLVRSATEEDVEVALEDASVIFPISNPADLIEAYNPILDVLGGTDDEGNVYGGAGEAASRQSFRRLRPWTSFVTSSAPFRTMVAQSSASSRRRSMYAERL